MAIRYSRELVIQARNEFQKAIKGKVIDHAVITDEYPDDIGITISAIVFTDGTSLQLDSSGQIDTPDVWAELDVMGNDG